MTIETWKDLGRRAPRELADARRDLHWGAQLPAAFALATPY